MPDIDHFSDFQAAVDATGGAPGAHWLGDMEQSKLAARFFLEAVQKFEPGDSGPVPVMANGLPVYVNELHISIYMPGGDITSRKVKPEDKIVYKAAWEAYERGNPEEITGTPLKEWPPATPAVIATLGAANVFNVEGLAELSDAHCEAIGNVAFIYRDKAQAWLAKAAGRDAEVDELKAQNAAMAEQLAAMQAAIDKMNRPRGRPRGSKNKVKPDVTADDGPGGDGQA